MTDTPLTTVDEPPFDLEAIAVHAARYRENKLKTWLLFATLPLIPLLSIALVLVALRPPTVRYLRIDAMGRAGFIRYSDLNYTPLAGDVQHYLRQWAQYRFQILKAEAEKQPLNYLFLHHDIAQSDMARDAKNQTVAKVMTGQAPENLIEVHSVEIHDWRTKVQDDVTLAKGEAEIDLTKLFAQPTRQEHWRVAVQFFVNSQQVSKFADPRYELENPLGVTITSYFANRMPE